MVTENTPLISADEGSHQAETPTGFELSKAFSTLNSVSIDSSDRICGKLDELIQNPPNDAIYINLFRGVFVLAIPVRLLGAPFSPGFAGHSMNNALMAALKASAVAMLGLLVYLFAYVLLVSVYGEGCADRWRVAAVL